MNRTKVVKNLFCANQLDLVINFYDMIKVTVILVSFVRFGTTLRSRKTGAI